MTKGAFRPENYLLYHTSHFLSRGKMNKLLKIFS
nr:MAG TPA: hypothetical protein [Caudoviricetes sp.]